MEWRYIVHVVYVTGIRMIEEGIYGLSRGGLFRSYQVRHQTVEVCHPTLGYLLHIKISVRLDKILARTGLGDL